MIIGWIMLVVLWIVIVAFILLAIASLFRSTGR